MGHIGEKENIRDCTQARALSASGQENNRCSRDSTGALQKQGRGTDRLKEERR